MNDYSIFAANVKRYRIQQGLSQSQLATLTHISPKTLASLERGIVGKRFGATQVFRLSEALDCTPAALFLPPRQ